MSFSCIVGKNLMRTKSHFSELERVFAVTSHCTALHIYPQILSWVLKSLYIDIYVHYNAHVSLWMLPETGHTVIISPAGSTRARPLSDLPLNLCIWLFPWIGTLSFCTVSLTLISHSSVSHILWQLPSSLSLPPLSVCIQLVVLVLSHAPQLLGLK